ncbi:sugar phosphate isomerase/epimerase family protein [Acuticoccus sp. MNP-M23]|uniref:sugar phosphate isomerase/epimerase family protein n=1 Tax=Acuticoccus sp. MNP-M23 TaxID=3072793 RepID=UPI0028155756|nr:sugar phosphate isomerase/epimerase family protein [Acuticoccus sp. MNP-M23]WMS41776.1 sugar phosphate isomerase/epimerase family protein [Acuticoccus sp. MNP-M23]
MERRLKIALCNEVLRELPFDRQCAFAAAVGFDGLELAPFTLAENPEHLTDSDAARLRSTLAANGLSCCALHWLLAAPSGLSITTSDEAVLHRTHELMRRLVDFAAAVGAGVLVHGSPAQRVIAGKEDEASRQRARDAFAIAGEAAAAAGVVYCIEPLSTDETAYINTVAEAVSVVSEVASPGLKTMIDTAATARDGGDCARIIREFMPMGVLQHVHVNDPNRRGPGEGALRFAPIFDSLRETNYNGWVSAEPFVYEPDGMAAAARAAGVLTTLRDDRP